ncbi:MAG TPA: hypothetical protein VFI45_07260 [Candidatus Acidoferrum sp.]|nr:hypothetical protein [Candidatus Acidoferrum sp.]
MPPTRKDLLLAALVLLAIPAFAELTLRLARVEFDVQLYSPNRNLGWVLLPGASGLVSTETPQWVRINSHGFRDLERSYEKPPGTYRIAVLGNSWTEALQVPLEKTYPAVLQEKLNESSCFSGRKVEVLNFGVAGYSTAQEFLLLQQKVWDYHPDLVLLAFYPARDIANNVRELNNAAAPERSPYFVYRDGQLVLDDAFRSLPALQSRQIWLQTVGYQFDQHVKLLQAISTIQRFGKIRVAMAAAKEQAAKSGVDNLEFAIYSQPTSPAMQDAWKITEGLFLSMRDEIRAHGAEFRIITLAARPQVIPEPAKRTELLRKLGVQDFSYADNRINEIAATLGISVTNLAPVLSSYAESRHVYLNGFHSSNLGTGHWNETGHRVAGETIAADLCRAGNRGFVHEIFAPLPHKE